MIRMVEQRLELVTRKVYGSLGEVHGKVGIQPTHLLVDGDLNNDSYSNNL